MGNSENVAIALFVFSILFGIIGWFLANKDKSQEEMIKDLYAKHKEDSEKLAVLELQIAKNYHDKGEVTAMFESFKDYLDEKFTEMKATINEINDRRRPKGE